MTLAASLDNHTNQGQALLAQLQWHCLNADLRSYPIVLAGGAVTAGNWSLTQNEYLLNWSLMSVAMLIMLRVAWNKGKASCYSSCYRSCEKHQATGTALGDCTINHWGTSRFSWVCFYSLALVGVLSVCNTPPIYGQAIQQSDTEIVGGTAATTGDLSNEGGTISPGNLDQRFVGLWQVNSNLPGLSNGQIRLNQDGSVSGDAKLFGGGSKPADVDETNEYGTRKKYQYTSDLKKTWTVSNGELNIVTQEVFNVNGSEIHTDPQYNYTVTHKHRHVQKYLFDGNPPTVKLKDIAIEYEGLGGKSTQGGKTVYEEPKMKQKLSAFANAPIKPSITLSRVIEPSIKDGLLQTSQEFLDPFQCAFKALKDWSLDEFKGCYDIAQGEINDTAKHFAIEAGSSPGETNAIQHVTWQALTTIRYGEDFAKAIGDAHERFQTGSDIMIKDSAADLENNEIGRRLGLEIQNTLPPGASVTDISSYSELVKRQVAEAFQQGRLNTTGGGEGFVPQGQRPPVGIGQGWGKGGLIRNPNK